MSNNQDPDDGLIIEVSVPANTAIFYMEAALKIGFEELQRNGRFMRVVGAYEICSNIDEAEESYKALLACIMQVKQQVIMMVQSNPQSSPGGDNEDGGGVPGIAFAKTDKAGLSSSDDEEDEETSGRSPLED